MSNEPRIMASAVLNAVLAVAIIAEVLHHRSPVAAPVAAVARLDKAVAVDAEAKRPRAVRNGSALDRRRAMINRLRALGVPNDVLGLIANVDRDVEWEARFEARHGGPITFDALQLAKDRSKDNDLRAALGDEDFREWDLKNVLAEAMSAPVETTAVEADAIYDAKKKLESRLFDVRQANVNGTLDEAGVNAGNDKAFSDFNREMKAVLGSERYAKSQQLDDAFASGNLRAVLAKAQVEPTEGQFQELFGVEKQYSEAQLKLGEQRHDQPTSEDFPAQFRALDVARDEEYRRVLGSNAFDALQKAKDPGYGQMKKFKAYWGLDDSKIDSVYDALKQYNTAVLSYVAQADANGETVEAIKSSLGQITAQTEKKLQSQLSPESFNRLLRNGVVRLYHPNGGD